MAQEKYQNAPISEAMLQIGTVEATDSLFEILEAAFYDSIKEYFPYKDIRFGSTTRFSPFGHQAQTTHQRDALIFSSADRKVVVQARLDGIVISRLRPYDSWDDVRRPAEWVWERYSGLTHASVTHIGVRYINELRLPFKVPFEEFLRVYPEYPFRAAYDLPEYLNSFFMRLEWPVNLQDAPGRIVIQESTVGLDPEAQQFTMLLDLELAKSKSATLPLWESVDALRPIKNLVFEACITNRMREQLRGASAKN